METTPTYSAAAIKYEAKKALRALKANDLGCPKLPRHFSRIMLFAEENNQPKIMEQSQRIVSFLQGADDSLQEIIRIMTAIHKEISAINEKRTVMGVREIHAQNQHAREKKDAMAKGPETLNRYDIVKVPTQGGWHKSIVTEVKDSVVTCFPITTASRGQLDMLRVRSISLSDCGEDRYKGTRLSASARRIPLEDAIPCYMGTVSGNPKICRIVDKVSRMAS